jgi:8-oxo-dGTP diphosphatase
MASTIKYAATFKPQADEKNNQIVVKLTCYYADFEATLSPNPEIEAIYSMDYKDKHCCSLGSIQAMKWLKSKDLIK